MAAGGYGVGLVVHRRPSDRPVLVALEILVVETRPGADVHMREPIVWRAFVNRERHGITILVGSIRGRIVTRLGIGVPVFTTVGILDVTERRNAAIHPKRLTLADRAVQVECELGVCDGRGSTGAGGADTRSDW